MNLTEQFRAVLLDRFPSLAETVRESLIVTLLDVHRVSRAEGILEALRQLGPYITPDLRPAAAVVAARASLLEICGREGVVVS
jgi:hypothetical protein